MANRPPNILLLTTDQQRWDALGANGNPEIRTPRLDALACESLNFTSCIVQSPVCMPSRISMLSGRYPSSLGILDNGIPAPESVEFLPRLLKPRGLFCANLGKLHFLPHANRDYREPYPSFGFDHLEISDEPGCYEDAYRAWVRERAPEELDRISVGLPPAAIEWRKKMGIRETIRHADPRFTRGARVFPARSDVSHSAFVADRTIEFIRANRRRPFLAIAGFYSPHEPWVVAREYLDLYDPASLGVPAFPPELDARRGPGRFSDDELRDVKRGYYAMVSEVDFHVGRILDVLEETGLKNDTIVVFTSDHGEWLGEHLEYGKGFPAADCVSRVPLLMRFPERMAIGPGKVDGLVEAVDILPTLLGAVEALVPVDLQGHSLLQPPHGGRVSALTEMEKAKALRLASARYVRLESGEELLFDLATDPGEYRNVAADKSYARLLAEAREELARRIPPAIPPLPRTWTY